MKYIGFDDPRDSDPVTGGSCICFKKGIFMKNVYTGVLEKSIAQLITKRAKRMGISNNDLEDLQQQVALELWIFKYDFRKYKNASQKTIITAIIKHHLSKHLRSEKRYRDHLEKFNAEYKEEINDNFEIKSVNLRDTLNYLDMSDRQICEDLIDDLSINEISKKRNRSWNTIKRAINRLRKTLPNQLF